MDKESIVLQDNLVPYKAYVYHSNLNNQQQISICFKDLNNNVINRLHFDISANSNRHSIGSLDLTINVYYNTEKSKWVVEVQSKENTNSLLSSIEFSDEMNRVDLLISGRFSDDLNITTPSDIEFRKSIEVNGKFTVNTKGDILNKNSFFTFACEIDFKAVNYFNIGRVVANLACSLNIEESIYQNKTAGTFGYKVTTIKSKFLTNYGLLGCDVCNLFIEVGNDLVENLGTIYGVNVTYNSPNATLYNGSIEGIDSIDIYADNLKCSNYDIAICNTREALEQSEDCYKLFIFKNNATNALLLRYKSAENGHFQNAELPFTAFGNQVVQEKWKRMERQYYHKHLPELLDAMLQHGIEIPNIKVKISSPILNLHVYNFDLDHQLNCSENIWHIWYPPCFPEIPLFRLDKPIYLNGNFSIIYSNEIEEPNESELIISNRVLLSGNKFDINLPNTNVILKHDENKMTVKCYASDLNITSKFLNIEDAKINAHSIIIDSETVFIGKLISVPTKKVVAKFESLKYATDIIPIGTKTYINTIENPYNNNSLVSMPYIMSNGSGIVAKDYINIKSDNLTIGGKVSSLTLTISPKTIDKLDAICLSGAINVNELHLVNADLILDRLLSRFVFDRRNWHMVEEEKRRHGLLNKALNRKKIVDIEKCFISNHEYRFIASNKATCTAENISGNGNLVLKCGSDLNYRTKSETVSIVSEPLELELKQRVEDSSNPSANTEYTNVFHNNISNDVKINDVILNNTKISANIAAPEINLTLSKGVDLILGHHVGKKELPPPIKDLSSSVLSLRNIKHVSNETLKAQLETNQSIRFSIQERNQFNKSEAQAIYTNLLSNVVIIEGNGPREFDPRHDVFALTPNLLLQEIKKDCSTRLNRNYIEHGKPIDVDYLNELHSNSMKFYRNSINNNLPRITSADIENLELLESTNNASVHDKPMIVYISISSGDCINILKPHVYIPMSLRNEVAGCGTATVTNSFEIQNESSYLHQAEDDEKKEDEELSLATTTANQETKNVVISGRLTTEKVHVQVSQSVKLIAAKLQVKEDVVINSLEGNVELLALLDKIPELFGHTSNLKTTEVIANKIRLISSSGKIETHSVKLEVADIIEAYSKVLIDIADAVYAVEEKKTLNSYSFKSSEIHHPSTLSGNGINIAADNVLLQATSVTGKTDIQASNVVLASVADEYKESYRSKTKKRELFFKRTIQEASSSEKSIPKGVRFADEVNITAKNTIAATQTEFKSGGQLEAPEVKLVSALQIEADNSFSSDSDIFWVSCNTREFKSEKYISCSSGENLRIKANKTLIEIADEQFKEFSSKLISLNDDNDIVYKNLKQTLIEHCESHEQPGVGLAIIISIGVAIATYGAGAHLVAASAAASTSANVSTAALIQSFSISQKIAAAAIQGAITNLASSATIALLKNNGNPFKASKDLVSAENFKGLFSAMASGALSAGIGASDILATKEGSNAFIKAATNNLIRYGVSTSLDALAEEDNKTRAGKVKDGLANALASTLTDWIAPGINDFENPVARVAGHAALGATAGAIKNGKSGLLAGAVAGATSASYMELDSTKARLLKNIVDNNTDGLAKEQHIAELATSLVGIFMDRDAKDLGIMRDTSAIVHNSYLSSSLRNAHSINAEEEIKEEQYPLEESETTNEDQVAHEENSHHDEDLTIEEKKSNVEIESKQEKNLNEENHHSKKYDDMSTINLTDNIEETKVSDIEKDFSTSPVVVENAEIESKQEKNLTEEKSYVKKYDDASTINLMENIEEIKVSDFDNYYSTISVVIKDGDKDEGNKNENTQKIFNNILYPLIDDDIKETSKEILKLTRDNKLLRNVLEKLSKQNTSSINLSTKKLLAEDNEIIRGNLPDRGITIFSGEKEFSKKVSFPKKEDKALAITDNSLSQKNNKDLAVISKSLAVRKSKDVFYDFTKNLLNLPGFENTSRRYESGTYVISSEYEIINTEIGGGKLKVGINPKLQWTPVKAYCDHDSNGYKYHLSSDAELRTNILDYKSENGDIEATVDVGKLQATANFNIDVSNDSKRKEINVGISAKASALSGGVKLSQQPILCFPEHYCVMGGFEAEADLISIGGVASFDAKTNEYGYFESKGKLGASVGAGMNIAYDLSIVKSNEDIRNKALINNLPSYIHSLITEIGAGIDNELGAEIDNFDKDTFGKYLKSL